MVKIPPFKERPIYLQRIMPFAGKEIIKAVVGQRRVGKSYMLFQLMDKISSLDPEGRQIYINKELHEFASIRAGEDLISYVEKRRDPNSKTYLFIDELQEIEGFESALRHFQAEGGFDVYVTGSNAKLLSGELATYLSGRYVEFKVYGLTYPEFVEFHDLAKGRNSLESYMKFGGLPYLMHLDLKESIVFDYLRNICDAILLKDVVARFNVRNVPFLQRLARFLADNVGSLVTARKIGNYLKSQKVKVSNNLVLDYLSYLATAFLVFRVNRLDIGGRKIFEIGEKIYFEDLGIRHALVGFRPMDINKILENMVYMHLRAAGYEIMVGKTGEREIDFVCEKNGERLYVQVAYLLADEKVRQREFGNLLAVSDNYPKFVVSMDELPEGTYRGVRHVHVLDFMNSVLGPRID
jgi:predicted AAA+ superfamily ATPase